MIPRSNSYRAIQEILQAAIAKAGNPHRLAVALGINDATMWRTRNGIGSLSAPLLLSVCNYLGWADAVAIIQANTPEPTVGDYIDNNKTIGLAQ